MLLLGTSPFVFLSPLVTSSTTLRSLSYRQLPCLPPLGDTCAEKGRKESLTSWIHSLPISPFFTFTLFLVTSFIGSSGPCWLSRDTGGFSTEKKKNTTHPVLKLTESLGRAGDCEPLMPLLAEKGMGDCFQTPGWASRMLAFLTSQWKQCEWKGSFNGPPAGRQPQF